MRELVAEFCKAVSDGTYHAPYEYNTPALDAQDMYVLITHDPAEPDVGERERVTVELRTDCDELWHACCAVGDIDAIVALVERAVAKA